MKILLQLILLCSALAHADSPRNIQQTYANEAATRQPGFVASAARGEALFQQRFTHNDKMPSCTSCHTEHPGSPGQHVITGKAIKPLAIIGNGERFSDPTKVEKWFGRNCQEVVGRACTGAEKADFITYMQAVR